MVAAKRNGIIPSIDRHYPGQSIIVASDLSRARKAIDVGLAILGPVFDIGQMYFIRLDRLGDLAAERQKHIVIAAKPLGVEAVKITAFLINNSASYNQSADKHPACTAGRQPQSPHCSQRQTIISGYRR